MIPYDKLKVGMEVEAWNDATREWLPAKLRELPRPSGDNKGLFAWVVFLGRGWSATPLPVLVDAELRLKPEGGGG